MLIFSFASLAFGGMSAKTNVNETAACTSFQEFYGFRPQIQIFNPFRVDFCIWSKTLVVAEMEGKKERLNWFSLKMIHILLPMMIMTILLMPFIFVGALLCAKHRAKSI